MQTFFTSYLNIALQLVAANDGTQPLTSYLKKYFSLHKKHGSKDRKWIAHFCYCYYRLGFALQQLTNKDRLLIAIFLCSDKTGNWLTLYDENWQTAYSENIDERIRFIQSIYSFSVEEIFFYNNWLSNDIDAVFLSKSHLIQPHLFLRIRPGKTKIVTDKIRTQNLSFEQINESCLALNNATKIDAVINLNKEAVVQDFSSQQIASFFPLLNLSKPVAVWDCCAASGGKSILAYDFFGNIKLAVSDIRESIIHNLKQRFLQASILHYTSFTADVSSQQFLPKQQYDLVICDAPCSGSGTWSRTPEQLLFFTEEKLSHYTELQKKITAVVGKAIKRDGYLLYITCSVFRQENEDIVKHILTVSKLKLVKAGTIKGYAVKADTMFAALFINQ